MIEFLLTNAPVLIAALVALSALVLLVFALRRWRAEAGNPTLETIMDSLLPLVYTAILGAEKVAQEVLSRTGEAADRTDKKAVADSFYALIPEFIQVRGFPVPVAAVKALVTREMFQELVKNVYDKANAEIMKQKAYLRTQVDNLIPDEFEPNKQATVTYVAAESATSGQAVTNVTINAQPSDDTQIVIDPENRVLDDMG